MPNAWFLHLDVPEPATRPSSPSGAQSAIAAAAQARPFWQARTGAEPAALFLTFSESTSDDLRFMAADVAGTVAHVAGLHNAGLLERDEAIALIAAVQASGAGFLRGDQVLDVQLEDGHMNLEHAVTRSLGPLGAKLHTGRSRNDQVATCLTLQARLGAAQLAAATHHLAQALSKQAALHLETPWVARTHGKPAQPATIGYLLTAHALRLQALVGDALGTFASLRESPLGSGAVAGSTLPLDPAYTARLLGLAPPSHALLSTGTRDTVGNVLHLTTRLGHALSSLAADLLTLDAEGRYLCPSAFTSGSSLMPHKRNPDALELARGRGKALAGLLASYHAATAGLGLGYHREFQDTKPLLTQALDVAGQTVEVLEAVVDQGRFVDLPWPADPGLLATDVAEALVQEGVPFRHAYKATAAAFAAHLDEGVGFNQALEASCTTAGFSSMQTAAALAVTTPDPARRATRGGPAPVAMQQALHELADASTAHEQAVAAALHEAGLPLRLQSLPPAQILDSGAIA